MALPTTIKTGDLVTTHNRFRGGPFISSGGDVYVIICVLVTSPADLDLKCYKATDPTSSFSLQDTSNEPQNTNNLSFACVQEGDLIHVIYPADDIEHMSFNMADDTWSSPHTIQTGNFTPVEFDVAIDAAGDLVMVGPSAIDRIHGTDYFRVSYSRSTDSGVNWSTYTQFGSADPTNEQGHTQGPAVVKGSAGRFHLFWTQTTTSDFDHRTLTEASTLESIQTIDTTLAVPGTVILMVAGASYISASNTVVWVMYTDFDNIYASAKANSAASPSWTLDGTTFLDNNHRAFLNTLIADGTDLYSVYPFTISTNGKILFNVNPDDAGWAADDTEAESESGNDILLVNANIYERSGTKYLATVYHVDLTTDEMRYEEHALTVAITGTVAQTLPSITQQATGTSKFVGTVAQTLPSITQQATGTSKFVGAVAQTLPTITQAATGWAEVTGAMAQTLPAITQQATGEEKFVGTIAQVLPSITQQAVGWAEITGAMAQLLPSITQQAVGTSVGLVDVFGTIAQTLPAIIQAAIALHRTGLEQIVEWDAFVTLIDDRDATLARISEADALITRVSDVDARIT